MYLEDPENFYKEWVYFDLHNDKAVYNVWDLIYDYCCYYGCGYLSDLRDETQKLTDNLLEGGNYFFPQGKVFVLNYIVHPARWIDKFTKKSNRKVIQFKIEANKVKRIVGNLADFIIIFDNYQLHLGKTIKIEIDQKIGR
jgi:hypothetical protein